MNLLHVSIFIIACAFAVLVYFIGKSLTSMSKTLDELTKTTSSLEQQMQGITRESEELLHRTNALAEDIQQKSEELNKVVHAVSEIGDTVTTFNGKVRNVSDTVTSQLEVSADKIVQVTEVVNMVLDKVAELRNNRALKKAMKREGA